MQGSWNNGAPYYRCVFLSNYAAKDSPRASADPGVEAAQKEIADCDASLRQYRAALEAGVSPRDRHRPDQRDPGEAERCRSALAPSAGQASTYDPIGLFCWVVFATYARSAGQTCCWDAGDGVMAAASRVPGP
jgi:hypothetical protein